VKIEDLLRHRLIFSLVSLVSLTFSTLAATGQSFNGVLTWQNDNGRTGQNLNETVLTPANVNITTFGKVFAFQVDGNVFAQPLYVPNVTIPNQGVHNVLYVATENDSVYAFDADGQSTTPLWQVSFIDPANNITPEACLDANNGCVITPVVGITGTPVIDPSTGTLYLVAVTDESGLFFQRLHALDITSGAEKFGGPVVVQPTFPGTGPGSRNGIVRFGSAHHLQRPGLLLLNDVVYVAWTGTHGWIVGYDALTLAQVAVFNSSPNTRYAGIWQSGAGLAADSQGNIYAATGDGTFDADTGGNSYGDTLLKLNSSLQVVDYFTPMDQLCRNAHDQDLASGGPVVLPTQSGPTPDEVLLSGKGGYPCDLFGSTYASPFYVLNQNQLGGYNPSQDQNVQTVAGAPEFVYGTPAYWTGPNGSYVYLSGFLRGSDAGDFLRAFSITNGLLSPSPIALTKTRFPVGSSPSVSANGTTNGILWAVKRGDSLDNNPGPDPTVLVAFDATNVAKLLYSTTQKQSLEDVGAPATKFLPPTVANGRVYVGTQSEIDVYGLLPVSVSPIKLVFATRTVGMSSLVKTITLTNTQSKTLNISSISTSGDFFETHPTCASSLAPSTSCTINVTFTPSTSGTRTGTLSVADDAPGSTQSVSLSGIGTFVGLSATTLPFGSVPVGTNSRTKKIIVTNKGSALVNITNISIGGPNATDFVQTNTCGQSLAAGASCTITFGFTPTATGNRSATLSIVDDDLGSPQNVALSGIGS